MYTQYLPEDDPRLAILISLLIILLFAITEPKLISESISRLQHRINLQRKYMVIFS